MANIQYMTDSRGQRVSVVVPVELFEKLVSSSDLDEFYEPVTIDAGASDDIHYPNEVINILSEKDCSMQAAWRIYRGMTQKQVADALGINNQQSQNLKNQKTPARRT